MMISTQAAEPLGEDGNHSFSRSVLQEGGGPSQRRPSMYLVVLVGLVDLLRMNVVGVV
jgi:hypothetical protein